MFDVHCLQPIVLCSMTPPVTHCKDHVVPLGNLSIGPECLDLL